MNMKQAEKILSEQSNRLNDLFEMVAMIATELPLKDKPSTTPRDIHPPVSTISVESVKSSAPLTTGLPPPSKWREKVTELLGEDFGLEVEESSGGNYIIKVYLPEKYDRRVGDERKGRDCSTGLVRRASDLMDVEKWCNLIKSNIQKKYPEFKKV